MTTALAAPLAPPAPPHEVFERSLDELPPMLILPHPKTVGFGRMDADWNMISADGKPTQTHPMLSIGSAFGLDQRTDAHFCCYAVEDSTGALIIDEIPRLTKPLVAGLEHLCEEEQGLLQAGHIDASRALFTKIGRIVGTALAIDFDLPKHVRWTDAHREQVQELLRQASARFPQLARPTVFYITNGGFRLVWLLAQRVDVHGAGGLEDLFYGLVAHAYISGLIVDTACKDWTRLFRLPRVVRADKPPAEAQTWHQAYYAQSWGRIDFAAREALPPGGRVLVHAAASFQPLSTMRLDQFDANAQARELKEKWKQLIGRPPRDLRDTLRSVVVGEQPDSGAVQQLLTGGGTQSAAYKQVISRLRSMGFPRDKERIVSEAKHAYEVLAEGVDICVIENDQKQMHQGIAKLARALCYCFRDRLGDREVDVTPQFIQALVVQPARKANAARMADGSGKARSEAEIDSEVWRLVAWFYRHFRGTAIVEAEEVDEEAKERSDLQLRLIGQVGAHQDAIVRTFVEWSRSDDPIIHEWIKQNWNTCLLLKHLQGRSVLSLGQNGSVYYSTPVEVWADVLSLIRDSNHNLITTTTFNKHGAERIRNAEQVYRECSRVTDDVMFSRLVPMNQLRIMRSPLGCAPVFVQALPGMRTDIEPKFDPQADEWLHYMGGDAVEHLFNWLAAFPKIDRPSAALYLQGPAGVGKGMLGQALKNMTVRRIAAPLDQVVQDFQDTMWKTPFLWADEKVTVRHMRKALMDTFKKVISGEADTLNIKKKEHITVDGHWRVLITSNHANALPWDEEVSGADLKAIEKRLIHVTASPVAATFLEKIGQRDGTEGWPERVLPAHIMHLVMTRKLTSGKRFLVEAQPTQYHADMQSRTVGTDEVLRFVGRMLREPQKYPTCLFVRDDEVYFNVPSGFEVIAKIAAQDRVRGRLPETERLLTKSIKNVSKSEAAENIRVDTATAKYGKVLKLWKLDVRHIINWLDRHDQDCDLRIALGPVIWRRDAPPHVQETLERMLPMARLGKPGMPPSSSSPPAPPPPDSKVVPFPTIGLQSFK